MLIKGLTDLELIGEGLDVQEERCSEVASSRHLCYLEGHCDWKEQLLGHCEPDISKQCSPTYLIAVHHDLYAGA